MQKLILSASRAGASAVKIQTYTPEEMTINTSKGSFLLKKRIVCGEDKNYLICTQRVVLLENGTKNYSTFAKKYTTFQHSF